MVNQRDFVEDVSDEDITQVLRLTLAGKMTLVDVYNLYADLPFRDYERVYSMYTTMRHEIVQLFSDCLTHSPLFPEDLPELQVIWLLRKADLQLAAAKLDAFHAKTETIERCNRASARVNNRYPEEEIRFSGVSS